MSAQSTLERLAEAGFSLRASLTIAEYNARVPRARRAPSARFASVWVVGNAGTALWSCFQASPEYGWEVDPLDLYTRRCFREAVAIDQDFALYQDQREEQYLPMVELARTAGLGSPGRIGVLLHPDYGPWISLRGVLFAQEPIQVPQRPSFDPCTGCPAPCEQACHASVVTASGVDPVACYQARETLPECALRCDARGACILGPEHRFAPEQVAHHSRIRRRD